MKLFLMLCGSFILLTTSYVLADACVRITSVPATNQYYKVDGHVDTNSLKWNYVLTDIKTGDKKTGPLPIDWTHAHLYFFLSQDGKRFAVLDAITGHRLYNRFMIYDSEGKLIASLGVKDILNKYEQTKVQHTVSHIHWLKDDPKLNSYGKYSPDQNTVSLTTITGREVVISLTDGKLIKKQE